MIIINYRNYRLNEFKLMKSIKLNELNLLGLMLGLGLYVETNKLMSLNQLNESVKLLH